MEIRREMEATVAREGDQVVIQWGGSLSLSLTPQAAHNLGSLLITHADMIPPRWTREWWEAKGVEIVDELPPETNSEEA